MRQRMLCRTKPTVNTFCNLGGMLLMVTVFGPGLPLWAAERPNIVIILSDDMGYSGYRLLRQ